MSSTVINVLKNTAQKHPGKLAVKYKQHNSWKSLTWQSYQQEIMLVARGMAALGLSTGDFITILSQNCYQWVEANVAAIAAGAIPAGIYPTCSESQCQYIINHCKASVVVLEDQKQLEKILSIREQLPSLKYIVMINGASQEDNVYSWQDLLDAAKRFSSEELETRIKEQKPEDLATLVYTSGTTSNPKAVMLSHENLTWTAQTTCSKELQMNTEDVLLSYLPLSHIAEQMTTIHGPMYAGACVWFAESIESMPDNLKDARPTLFLGVPRVWEKIQAKMLEKSAQNSPLKRKIAKWAKSVGLETAKRLEKGKSPHSLFKLADKLVFNKVKEALGLDRCRIQVTAAAPISKDTLNFFVSLNIPLYEIFGMSESSGPATISYPGQFKVGKTGKTLTGTEIKIAEDGEIMLRGKHVFMGYLNNESETKETINPEGWLHTGDRGEIDSEGYLAITGRKKNIIITAGGENIAPEMLENKLKGIEGVEQAVVVGDQKKYLSALITLSPESPDLQKLAEQKGASCKDLAFDKNINAYFNEKISLLNKDLARVQTIKRFCLLPENFTEKDGELTPTMKIKRNIVIEKYKEQIDTMY